MSDVSHALVIPILTAWTHDWTTNAAAIKDEGIRMCVNLERLQSLASAEGKLNLRSRGRAFHATPPSDGYQRNRFVTLPRHMTGVSDHTA